MAPLSVRVGARLVKTLEVGSDLTAVILTCFIRDLDAAAAVDDVTMDNSPGTTPTSAVLTIPETLTSILDPTVRYWYQVRTADELVIEEGPLFVAPDWPA